MHDEAAISAEFRVFAARADDELRESGRAGADRDEVLARSCVYGYLYNRHFLESREKLLNELRWLRQSARPRAPAHAVSAERFDRCRDVLLDALIGRFAGDPESDVGLQ